MGRAFHAPSVLRARKAHAASGSAHDKRERMQKQMRRAHSPRRVRRFPPYTPHVRPPCSVCRSFSRPLHKMRPSQRTQAHRGKRARAPRSFASSARFLAPLPEARPGPAGESRPRREADESTLCARARATAPQGSNQRARAHAAVMNSAHKVKTRVKTALEAPWMGERAPRPPARLSHLGWRRARRRRAASG